MFLLQNLCTFTISTNFEKNIYQGITYILELRPSVRFEDFHAVYYQKKNSHWLLEIIIDRHYFSFAPVKIMHHERDLFQFLDQIQALMIHHEKPSDSQVEVKKLLLSISRQKDANKSKSGTLVIGSKCGCRTCETNTKSLRILKSRYKNCCRLFLGQRMQTNRSLAPSW